MGCSESKADQLPLVVRCRQRRDLIRSAENHRYALAASHVSYFRSLKDVGDALRKFVDEELATASASSSPSFYSPSLTLPQNSKQKHDNGDDDESHLNLSSSSSEDGDSDYFAHHVHSHNHRGYGYESVADDDDTHQNHKHHELVHKRKKGFVHQGKGMDEDDDASSNKNYKPRAGDGFDEHGEGFRDEFGDEGGSSSHYPRGGSNGFGDGLGNDPHMNKYPYPYPFQPPRQYGEPYINQWGPQGMPTAAAQPWHYSNSSNMYYMKKAASGAHTVVQKPPVEGSYGHSNSYWNSSVVGYWNASYGGNYGYASDGERVKVNQKKEAPPPPLPKASAWDFFNPFDGLNNRYVDYYSSGRYGYGSNSSSPDLTELREREGIPDLEEETESEVHKDVLKGNRVNVEAKKSPGDQISTSHSRALPAAAFNYSEHKNRLNSEGTSRSVPQHRRASSSSRKVSLHKSKGNLKSVPVHNSDSCSKSVPSWSSEECEKPYGAPRYKRDSAKKQYMPSQYSEKSMEPSPLDQSLSREIESLISLTDENSSPEMDVVSKSVDMGRVKKNGMSFEVEEVSNKQDGDLSKVDSVTLLLPSGTRDLREVVAEIRDEFETAASYGKEVAVMLEVGKMPYQPSFLKVISRMLYPISPSMSSRDPPSMQSKKLASKTMKLAKSYFEDVGKDENSKACNLSSTLDRLYAWEKKLYTEVKDEEKLRIMYEKKFKKLNNLDQEGAESSKIDVTRASMTRLLTKLDVSVKAINAISIRIQKLRDEELQPQVADLIHGLIRMWKVMLKFHEKQFRAVMESKMRRLKANIALQSDPTSLAITGLERELHAWCDRFNEWIASQKSYAESLNGWLLHCLQYEPEETPDGAVPYSPGRLGAPPIFVIFNDWHMAMKAISEAQVANAMNTFATSLRLLWEKQDEEGRQRLRAEYLSKDYEKQLKANLVDTCHDSGKTGLSVVLPDQSGVSALDDLKVDLDSMREKLAEERVKHKTAMQIVHDAASSSLQGGLLPIFKALEIFTSEALKSHEHVRLDHPGPGV